MLELRVILEPTFSHSSNFSWSKNHDNDTNYTTQNHKLKIISLMVHENYTKLLILHKITLPNSNS